MTFKELEYIWAIATEKSITKAARKLNVSQPAISRCLLNLEKELEISLFEKIEGNYVPTSAGNLYLQFAKDVLTRKIQFDSDFQELLQYRQGSLRFGITPGRSKSLTPAVLPKISKHFPDIKIELFEETVHDLEEALRIGKIDVAYFTVGDQLEANHAGLHYEFLSKEEIVMTVRKGTHLKEEPKYKIGFLYPWIDISQFKEHPFILLKKNMRLGQIAAHILRENKLAPQTIEIAGIDTAQELAANGYGICLCSSLGVREYKERLDIYSFGKQPVNWQFVAVYRIGSFMTEPLRYLTECYKNAAKSLQNRDI
nr:LysR family transcriptional regulator [uncultured Schaedlerella sp.]